MTPAPTSSTFDRSLVAYALAGGSLASSASGAIVYSGVQNLSLTAGSGTANTLAIDVDGGGADFTLAFIAHDGSNQGSLDIQTSTGAGALNNGTKGVAAALSANASISASSGNYFNNTVKLMARYNSTTGAGEAGDWYGQSNKYIAGRIETSPGSGQYSYGWIEASVPSTAAGTVTVHGWAYETTPEQSILAGQTTAIPGGGAMALFSLGAAGLGRWRKRSRTA